MIWETSVIKGHLSRVLEDGRQEGFNTYLGENVPGRSMENTEAGACSASWETAKRPASPHRASTWREAGHDVRARGQSRGRTGDGLRGCSPDLLLTQSEIRNRERGLNESTYEQDHFRCCVGKG